MRCNYAIICCVCILHKNKTGTWFHELKQQWIVWYNAKKLSCLCCIFKLWWCQPYCELEWCSLRKTEIAEMIKKFKKKKKNWSHVWYFYHVSYLILLSKSVWMYFHVHSPLFCFIFLFFCIFKDTLRKHAWLYLVTGIYFTRANLISISGTLLWKPVCRARLFSASVATSTLWI